MRACRCWRARTTRPARTSPPPSSPCRSISTRPRAARRPRPRNCSRCRRRCATWSCRASTKPWLPWRRPRPGSKAAMRATLWLLALFGIAVAGALFAGNNQGTVTLFWPPYRVDVSLNLVLLLLVAAFALLHAALGALAALFDLPRQALRWRTQQKERAMHGAMLDAISHLMAGRFIRARKAAEAALAQEKSLSG